MSISTSAKEGSQMIRIVLGSIAMAAMFATAPLAAQQADCSSDSIAKASDALGKMPDGEKKTLAQGELASAKDAFEKKDMAECKTHLTVVNYRLSAGN